MSNRGRSNFLEPNAANNHPSSIRSLSANPSVRSSRSRITLVEYDSDLATDVKTTDNALSGTKEYTWFDHLLAVFCVSRKAKDGLADNAEEKPEPERRVEQLHSPWVLPVYVLSPHRDASQHLIPQEAKCTIDTGNLQGNIVSKAFVVDILGFTTSNFRKLTTEEENGGTGVTGDKLVPESAIYLTWYHHNSTRVFRDMRFLVSEHPMYDLIIGARSIHEHNILDVPNLMAGEGGGAIQFDPKHTSEKKEDLLIEMNKASADETKALRALKAAEKNSKDQEAITKKKTNHRNLYDKYFDAMARYEIEGIRVQEEKSKKTATEERKLFESKHKGKKYVLPAPPGGKEKESKKDK